MACHPVSLTVNYAQGRRSGSVKKKLCAMKSRGLRIGANCYAKYLGSSNPVELRHSGFS